MTEDEFRTLRHELENFHDDMIKTGVLPKDFPKPPLPVDPKKAEADFEYTRTWFDCIVHYLTFWIWVLPALALLFIILPIVYQSLTTVSSQPIHYLPNTRLVSEKVKLGELLRLQIETRRRSDCVLKKTEYRVWTDKRWKALDKVTIEQKTIQFDLQGLPCGKHQLQWLDYFQCRRETKTTIIESPSLGFELMCPLRPRPLPFVVRPRSN